MRKKKSLLILFLLSIPFSYFIFYKMVQNQEDVSVVNRIKIQSRSFFDDRIKVIKNYCEKKDESRSRWAFNVDLLRMWHTPYYHFSACTVPKVQQTQRNVSNKSSFPQEICLKYFKFDDQNFPRLAAQPGSST